MLQYQGFGGVDGRVAGSTHVFTLTTKNGVEKVLFDCGNPMNRSGVKSNVNYDQITEGLTAILIGHAHEDHSGELPEIYLRGYKGKCYTHKASADIIMNDIKEIKSMEYMNLKSYNDSIRGKKDANGKFIPWAKPRLGALNMAEIVSSFAGVDYEQRVKVSDNIEAIFHEAGHILGSAVTELRFNDNGNIIPIVMAVDLGRDDMDIPMLNPPFKNFPADIRYCFIEATYGDRFHQDRQTTKECLEEEIMKLIPDKSRGLMANFAKQRTHWTVCDLFDMYNEGVFPSDFKIYCDSPGAIHYCKSVIKHRECLDERAQDLFFTNGKLNKINPFSFPNLVFVENRADSQALNTLPGPFLLESSSGMYSMGRIKGHLPFFIEDPNATLFRSGYQAEHTIGRTLEEGKEKHPVVNIDGKSFQYRAKWVEIKGYSAHADGNQCVHYVVDFVKPTGGVFVVHGEKQQSEWTQRALLARNQKSEIVRLNQVYTL